jgi:hypothetical protein
MNLGGSTHLDDVGKEILSVKKPLISWVKLSHRIVLGIWNHTIGGLLKLLLTGLIRAYQILISPLLGDVCRYYPSCSHYGLEAIRTHGPVKGSLLSAWRILRCHPWATGGVDPVPEKGKWHNPEVIELSTKKIGG